MIFGSSDEKEKQGPEMEHSTPTSGQDGTERPEKKGIKYFKAFFFALLILYMLISFFRVPLLTQLGRYLVVQNSAEKVDLIVCLAGNNIERGLAAIDAYQAGWAPLIFFMREERPDGYQALLDKGLHYPQSWDLLKNLLREAQIPESAVMAEETIVKSTFDEARTVSEMIRQKGYHSVMIVTSPTHTRRTMLTFRHALRDQKVRIIMRPSPYSGFKPETWWKQRRYVREVILEYQKLIYYMFTLFLPLRAEPISFPKNGRKN